jgi:hypothetical protein
MTANCLGCINLSDIDGRLCCADPRSQQHGAVIHWPGLGCDRKTGEDRVYGGGAYHTRCHDCGRFLAREDWVPLSHSWKRHALCGDCASEYDSPYDF